MPKPKKDTGFLDGRARAGASVDRTGSRPPSAPFPSEAWAISPSSGLRDELGATKGSFYWHFTDRPALVEAVLEEWERRDTDHLIERASALDDPRARLQWLFHVVFAEDAVIGIDTALLADVADPAVSAALERVTSKRLRFIERQFKLMGASASADRALLTYTAFLGLGQLRRATPSLTPTGRRSTTYVGHVTDWLLD